jgi:hypothetical protein
MCASALVEESRESVALARTDAAAVELYSLRA